VLPALFGFQLGGAGSGNSAQGGYVDALSPEQQHQVKTRAQGVSGGPSQ
jgi:hypothetical protein